MLHLFLGISHLLSVHGGLLLLLLLHHHDLLDFFEGNFVAFMVEEFARLAILIVEAELLVLHVLLVILHLHLLFHHHLLAGALRRNILTLSGIVELIESTLQRNETVKNLGTRLN